MTSLNSPVRPEDILSDDQNTIDFNGLVARKGSVAAFLKNIEIIENDAASEQEKLGALAVMKELVPVVVAAGLHKHATFKNPEVQTLLDQESMKAAV